MNFEQWLMKMYKKSDGNDLSVRSIEHYIGAVKSISKDMFVAGIIKKPLFHMNLLELDLAISSIFSTPLFLAKNQKGNNMYGNAIKKYRCYVYFNTDENYRENDEIKKIRNNTSLSEYKKKELIESFEGYGTYYKLVQEKFDSRCVITGVSISKVLVASHIKPWIISSNEEKISGNNGLLLSSTYSKLFEGGLISFKDGGTIMISSLIDDDNRMKLNLEKNKIYDIKNNEEMSNYLKYHREVIFIK